MTFLASTGMPGRTWLDAATREARGLYWTGEGTTPFEVAYTEAPRPLTATRVRQLWKDRHGRRPSPLLLIVAHPEGAQLCGPWGDNPPVVQRGLSHAERLAMAVLEEKSPTLAVRRITESLAQDPDATAGLVNKGLLASHELHVGVPKRSDWSEAAERATPALMLRGKPLVERLGYQIDEQNRRNHAVLRIGRNGNSRAVAVFLDQTELPDQAAERFDRQTPVTFALRQAGQDNLPYVMTVRGAQIRLYSTATSGAAGQRGRTDTYVALDLTELPEEASAYLHLLFSADALSDGGTFEQIFQASQNFAADLSVRLRERIYTQVVPRLAYAIANREGAAKETKQDLDGHFRTAVTILFRLLFVAYAEDSKLLPLGVNDNYTEHAMKTSVQQVSRAINQDRDLGFDNPLTDVIEPDTDTTSSDLWDTCRALFVAIDQGRDMWGIPQYNGGLFSSDPEANPAGPTIERLRLTNAEFGPAFVALLIDRTPDGDVGPIDYRSLSVREFGTIYEGLLESELERADEPLTLKKESGKGEVYIPAKPGDTIVVQAGEVYLHNKAGARKSSGSYFTKQFAVEHLIETSVLPTLEAHLDEVRRLLDQGRGADAAERLFDFRVADISMGSGHFLTAVVDALEVRYSAFLSEHPIEGVTRMLNHLRQAAQDNLGDLAPTAEMETSALLRRLIARKCVYGVDLNPVSVELARVSMWIHTFVAGLPLSFLDHNLRTGDSLTGIGTLQEAQAALVSQGSQGGLFDDFLQAGLDAAQEPLERLRNTIDATTADVKAAREAEADVRASTKPLEDLFDVLAAARAGLIPVPEVAALEDLPSRTVETARAFTAEADSLHFPIAFPEVFSRERPGFDAIVGNPPWEEIVVEELGFWSIRSPGIKAMGAEEQQEKMTRLRTERADLYERYLDDREFAERQRSILGSTHYPGMGDGDPDLYKAFAWRFLRLARDGGAMGVVLPRSAFQAKGSGPWRKAALPVTDAFVVTVRNRDEWAFTDVNPGYTICLATLTNVRQGGGELRLAGRYDNPTAFMEGLASGGTTMSGETLTERIPESALPDLGSDAEADLFASLSAIPDLSESRVDFWVFASREFDVSNDRDKPDKPGVLKPEGDTPVFNHHNVDHFAFDRSAGEFTRADWVQAIALLRQRKRANARRSNSPFSTVAAARGIGWMQDGTAPAEHPRLAFRDVVHASNQRKCWAALLPRNTLLTNPAPFLMFATGGEREQLYLLGMLASSVCDWWSHLFVNLHMNYFIFYGLPIPIAQPDDERASRVAEIAATLAVTDDGDYGAFKSFATADGEPEDLLAELDGIASLLYGLDDHHLPLVWNDDYPLRPSLKKVKEHRKHWGHDE